MTDFRKNGSEYLETLPQMEEQSWDGYQVNPLLVNEGGKGFQDFGFLLDVGFDFDCRRVVAADLDLDGRVDLAVGRIEGTSGFFHNGKEDVEPPALLIMQNTLKEAKDRPWLGISLASSSTYSPQGARVILETDRRSVQAAIVSGDSFICQHPAQKHFGLAPDETVRAVTVKWANGRETEIEKPSLRQYHLVDPMP